MGSIIAWVKANWVTILAIWGGVCIVVDGIVSLTKTTADDEWWEKIKKVIVGIFSIKIG